MQNDARSKQMTQRMRKLERANKRLWFVVLLIGVTLVLTVTLPSNIVRARAFVLVDEDGQLRAALSARGEGAMLVLQTPNEQVQAELYVGQDHAALDLRAPNRAIVLSTSEDRLGLYTQRGGELLLPVMERWSPSGR